MNHVDELGLYLLLALTAAALCILLVVLVYVLARAASMGWYRSRLDHIKHIMGQDTENR